MSFVIIDSANMFFRAKHATRGDIETKIGMALHIMFNSVKQAWTKFNGSHLVFCFEGRSWRKAYYAPYKANRAVARAALTAKEKEEDEIFFEVFNDFAKFIQEKTNCTVLQHSQLEADDLIAGFIQAHPESKHVIISTDTDYHQLLNENVIQYNGVAETVTSIDGVFDKKGKPVIDKKTKNPVKIDPEWILFEKCMRGDTSDNVFSAYPGVRVKGSKNKVGLLEAFEDRNNKGWAWNNLLLQKWTDHVGQEHRVLDDYNRNKTLIDLSAQPDHIKEIIQHTVNECIVNAKDHSQVGIHLLKFCQTYNLTRISDSVQLFSPAFQSRMPK